MEAVMMFLTGGVALGVGLGVASVAMNATLRLVHLMSRTPAAERMVP